jgi:hypothetical protein
MVKKIHKTAMGSTIDMELVRLSNETVRAVGNMPVNARGDLIDSKGAIVKSREQIVNEYYQLHSNVPSSKKVNRNTIVPDELPKQMEPTFNNINDAEISTRSGSLADEIKKQLGGGDASTSGND